MRFHVGAVGKENDYRFFRAEAFGRARCVHRGVAGAVDNNAATQFGGFAGADFLQQADGVDDMGGVARGDVDMAPGLRADRNEDGVEIAVPLLCQHVLHLMVQDDTNPCRLDPSDFLHQDFAGQPVGGDAEVQHATGQRASLMNFDLVAEQGQVIGGGEAARTGANDEDPFPGAVIRDRYNPVVRGRLIAQEPFDRVDADRAVQVAAIAGRFAWVVADPPVDRGHRVFPHQVHPGLLELSRLRQGEPSLDVLAGGASAVAGGQEVNIHRTLDPLGAGFMPAEHVHRRAHVVHADAFERRGALARSGCFGTALPVSFRNKASTIANTMPAMPTELASWKTDRVSLPPLDSRVSR